MVVEKTDLSKTQLSQMTSSVLLTTAHSGKRTLFGNPHFQYFALKVALSIQTARYCGFTFSSQPSIKHLIDKIVSTSQNGRKVSNEKLAIANDYTCEPALHQWNWRREWWPLEREQHRPDRWKIEIETTRHFLNIQEWRRRQKPHAFSIWHEYLFCLHPYFKSTKRSAVDHLAHLSIHWVVSWWVGTNFFGHFLHPMRQ